MPQGQDHGSVWGWSQGLVWNNIQGSDWNQNGELVWGSVYNQEWGQNPTWDKDYELV